MDTLSYLLGKKAGGGGGSNLQVKSVPITENGSITINPDENYDGMSAVNLTTNVQPDLESKSLTISTNTVTTIRPTEGKDGLSSVEVTTNIPQPSGSINITENGTVDVTNYVTANVNVSSGQIEEKDVNFYDYDDTLLYSYTAQEINNLSALPANPTHTGLTSQGWNWTLAKIKSEISHMGKIDVAQLYTTDDGSIRIYTKMDNSNYLSPYLEFSAYQTCTIDWGDGNTETVSNGDVYTKYNHTYSTTGNYVIKVTTADGQGSIKFRGDANYVSHILTASATQSDVAPKSVADSVYRYYIYRIEGNANVSTNIFCGYLGSLEYCLDGGRNATNQRNFTNCRGLKNYVFGSISSVGSYSFYNCGCLKKVYLSSNQTTFSSNSFGYSGIEELILHSNASAYSGMIDNCFNLKKFINGKANSSFALATTLSNMEYVDLSNSTTSTSLSTGMGALKLKRFIGGTSISSIGSGYFQSPLLILDLRNCSSVPSLNANAFGFIPKRIIVPNSLYSSWISTTNWSTYANIIVKASDYVEE